MNMLRAANIDGRVLIFGNIILALHFYHTKIIIAGGQYYDGQSQYYDDILEFNPLENTFVPLGHMTQARGQHAISVVQVMDYTQWCH